MRVPGQLSLLPPSICVEVTVAEPIEESWTVKSLQIAVGPDISITVIVNIQTAVVPPDPVAVYVMVVTPIGNKEPEAGPPVCTTVIPEQLSKAVGAVQITFEAHLSASLPTVISEGQLLKVGT